MDTEDEYDSEELHAFNCFLAALSDIGYGFSYRVFDAQFFGLAQRRERVFVAGYLGDWRHACAVLVERESLSGHPAPRREQGERAAPTISTRTQGGGGLGTDFDLDGGLIAHTLRREGYDASEDGSGRGTPIVPVAFALRGREGGAMPEMQGDCAGALRAASGGSTRSYVAFGNTGQGYWGDTDTAATLGAHAGRSQYESTLMAFGGNRTSGDLEVAAALNAKGGTGRSDFESETLLAFDCKAGANTGFAIGDVAGALRGEGNGGGHAAIAGGAGVRRITPIEAERLQGFPDNFTRIPWRGKPAEECPDGPRYKAIGNSMAVPIMSWLGRRIQIAEDAINVRM